MPNFMSNIEIILSDYLTKKEVSEYKEIIEDKNNIEKQYQKLRNKKDPLYARWYYLAAKIDLLITFAKQKLQPHKFLEMLFHLGTASVARGEFKEAEKILLFVVAEIKVRPSKQEPGYPLDEMEASACLSLSGIYRRLANWKKSLKYIKIARAIYTKQKNIEGMAKCDNLVGIIEVEKGNLKKAAAHFRKSLKSDRVNDDSFKGLLEMNLGILNTIQGDFDTALIFYKNALEKFTRLNDIRRLGEVTHNLGMLYTQKGENEKALAEFNRSISLSLKSGNVYNVGLSYLQKANIYIRLNDYALASDFADKAMDIGTLLNDQLSIADIYKIKGIIERELKNYPAAENYLLTSRRRNRELENDLNEAEANYELGILYKQTNRVPEAKKSFLLAYKCFKKMGVSYMVTKIEGMIDLN